MPRKFEKISLQQFIKDTNLTKQDYNNYKLPTRSTKYSAGYDFESPINFTLKPNERKKIPLGVKVQMNNDEMLMLVVRSSQGFKYNVRMCNQVGIFESDYYNNESNEGHMWVALQNHGTADYIVKQGDRICQGIFTKFLTIDDEQTIKNTRQGGIGSTDKEWKNEPK